MNEKNLTQEQIDEINDKFAQEQIDEINDKFDSIAEEVVDCGNLNIICDLVPIEEKAAFIKLWKEQCENAGFDDEDEG